MEDESERDRSEGLPNGIFFPMAQGTDWAWTPWGSSSHAASQGWPGLALACPGWHGIQKFQNPNLDLPELVHHELFEKGGLGGGLVFFCLNIFGELFDGNL